MLDKYYDLRKEGFDHFDALERLNVTFDERIEIETHLENLEEIKSQIGKGVLISIALAICVGCYYIGQILLK